MLTEEQICEQAEATSNPLAAANRLLRAQDDSHLWPISGNFNATERAIRQTRTFQREYGELSLIEYIYQVCSRLSEIVNSTI